MSYRKHGVDYRVLTLSCFTLGFLRKILYAYLVLCCQKSVYTTLNKADVMLQKSVSVTLKLL